MNDVTRTSKKLDIDLPSWEACARRVEGCVDSALDRFIYDNEPAGKSDAEFRRGLQEVLREAQSAPEPPAPASKEQRWKVEPWRIQELKRHAEVLLSMHNVYECIALRDMIDEGLPVEDRAAHEPCPDAEALLEAYDACWIEDERFGHRATREGARAMSERFRSARTAVLTAMRPAQPPAPALVEAATCVANALACGMGAMIQGTLMEQDLRDALGLKKGEMRNVPKRPALTKCEGQS